MNDECASNQKQWQTFLLGDVAKIIDPHPSHRAPEEVTEGVPFVGIGDITESGQLLEGKARVVPFRTLDEHKVRYKLSSNSIGFGRVATIGKVINFQTNPGDITISPTMAIIEPFAINRDFLLHSLQGEAIKIAIDQWLTGTTRSSLGIELLRKIPVIAPDLNYQRKIAAILTTVDTAIEKTEALIEKYQQIKAGLMHDLFTRGVLPNGKLRPPREQAPELYQETAVGWIPKEWDLLTIGDVFDIQLGKMLSQKSKTGKYSAYYLGNKNVQWNRVDLSNLETMDFLPQEREKFSLKLNDLLVCEGGDVGRTSLWQSELENCYYQKAIHRLRPKDNKMLPQLMLQFMWYAKQTGLFSDFTSQTSIAHLTQEKLARVPLFIPEIMEQTRLVSRFESLDSILEKEQAKQEKLCAQKLGLMQDLLTGKVEVSVEGKD